MSVAEARTVYIKGLPDKPSKNEMKRALYLYCTQFGAVLDVQVLKTESLYGQAFVVFPDLAIANSCRRVMNNAVFYNRTVTVALADRPSFVADPAERRRRDMKREKMLQRPAAPERKRSREEL